MYFHNIYRLFVHYRENRYVLFLTENYAALDILMNPKNYLGEGLSLAAAKRDGRLASASEEIRPGSETEAAQESLDARTATDVQPFILFGSSFPKDKEYTMVQQKGDCAKIMT